MATTPRTPRPYAYPCGSWELLDTRTGVPGPMGRIAGLTALASPGLFAVGACARIGPRALLVMRVRVCAAQGTRWCSPTWAPPRCSERSRADWHRGRPLFLKLESEFCLFQYAVEFYTRSTARGKAGLVFPTRSILDSALLLRRIIFCACPRVEPALAMVGP